MVTPANRRAGPGKAAALRWATAHARRRAGCGVYAGGRLVGFGQLSGWLTAAPRVARQLEILLETRGGGLELAEKPPQLFEHWRFSFKS